MIVRVWARYADFCGNEEQHEWGLYEAPDVKAVEAVFPPNPIQGWVVEPVTPQELPTKVQKVPPLTKVRGY